MTELAAFSSETGDLGDRPASRPAVVETPTGIRSGTYVPELESLRGIAILLVFAFHADALLGMPFRNRAGTWPALPVALIWCGHTGVSLFFVLSAFLLSLPFLVEASGGRRVSRRAFYVRRALRILPLFYAAVLVATVATSKGTSDLWRAFPYFTFLFSKFGAAVRMAPYSGGWWSLAIEMQFYLVLPLVALVLGRGRRVIVLLLAAYATWWIAVALRWIARDMHPAVLALTLVGRSPLFLCGILAAWFYHRHGAAVRSRLAASSWLRLGGGDAALVLALALLAALLRWKLFWNAWTVQYESALLAPDGVLWALVVLGVLLLPLRLKPLLSNAALQRIGVLSYSLYLVHLPVLDLTLQQARRFFPAVSISWSAFSAAWVAFAALLCLGISSLTYRYIERPFLARKARVADPSAA